MELTQDLRAEWKIVLLLALVAMMLHIFLWIPFPAHIGPDGGAYSSYYVDVFQNGGDPFYFTNVMSRMPLAPVVQMLPLTIGLRVYQVMQTLLAMLAVIMTYFVARPWGIAAGIGAALLYMFSLPLQVQFHQLSVDSTFTLTILAASLSLRYVLANNTMRAWGIMGLMIALVVLTRANGLSLLMFGAAILFVGGTLQQRANRLAVMLLVFLIGVTPWVVFKGVRYDHWSLSRNGRQLFYGTYSNTGLSEGIIHPENGPASQELADLVSEHLLTSDNYQAYDITLDTFFSYDPTRRNNRFYEDAVVLHDEIYGWDSDSEHLLDVALEGIRAEPGAYFYLIFNNVRAGLFDRLQLQEVPAGRQSEVSEQVAFEPESLPSENEWIAEGVYWLWDSRPADRPEPSAQERAAFEAHVAEITAPLQAAEGSEALRNILDTLWTFAYPYPVMIYGLGLVALLSNRGKSLVYLVLILGAALIITLGNATVTSYQRYRMPIEALYLIPAAIGAAYLLNLILSSSVRDRFK
jgi:hypothetical protein